MATKKAEAAAPAKATGKKINRKRRNALERKCLSKTAKRVFAGCGKQMFKALLAAEVANKKRPKQAFEG